MLPARRGEEPLDFVAHHRPLRIRESAAAGVPGPDGEVAQALDSPCPPHPVPAASVRNWDFEVMRSTFLCATVLWAFSAGGLAAQSGGIPPEWEVRKQMTALAEHVQRVEPVLEQIHPEEWVKKGAPQAYVGQLSRTRAEIGYLVGSTKELAAHPERMTTALDTFFRMESVDAMLRSVAAGIRKYQNPAVAELLQGLIADTSADRDKLRQYLVDLAADREQQYKVMDQEAQRCRSTLSRQERPAARPTPRQEEHH